MDTLRRLEAWYTAQTDGDWEHSWGVHIGTLDNPGWEVNVDLVDTDCFGVAFEAVKVDRSPTDWVVCRVRDGLWEGRGGPGNLSELMNRFEDWAESIQAALH